MKKKVFLMGALLTLLQSNAQTNYYNFSTATEPYQELTEAISINQGTHWVSNHFPLVSLPFPVKVLGESCNSFRFSDDYFEFRSTNDAIVLTDPVSGGFYRDLSADTSYSLSSISYKIDGNEGARILKLELKNAGIEADNSLTKFINYQIWFYEADESIEYRYGNTNIVDGEIQELMSSWIPLLSAGTRKSSIYGNTTSGFNYSEGVGFNFNTTGVSNVIPANTVFRFEPISLSVKDYEKVTFNIYPNPVENVLTITFNEPIQKDYAIYDIVGRLVTSGAIDNKQSTQIDVSSLEKGNYILRIGGSSKNIIKK